MSQHYHRWSVTEGHSYRVEIPVESELGPADIASGVLNVEGQADTAMVVGPHASGYMLTADGVVMPGAGVYVWSVDAVETAGPVVTVAKGELHISEDV